jgi:signal transduction histidine kinase
LENVFEPYYKVDKSRNSKIEGWGLGLSIVKEIVSKHDGTINLDSAPNKGTRIEIML